MYLCIMTTRPLTDSLSLSPALTHTQAHHIIHIHKRTYKKTCACVTDLCVCVGWGGDTRTLMNIDEKGHTFTVSDISGRATTGLQLSSLCERKQNQMYSDELAFS